MQLAAVTCNQKSLFLKKFQKNLAILKELKADNKRRQTKRQKKGIKREAKSCKEMEQYERLCLCFFIWTTRELLVNRIYTHLQALYLSHCHKTRTRPPSCTTPREPNIYVDRINFMQSVENRKTETNIDCEERQKDRKLRWKET